MAPPPASSLPLGQRLAALAQTLQFAWFAGHVSLLIATFNAASKWAAFSYRVAFLSAAVTYGIVVYKAYRARMRSGKQGGIFTLATDENVQYLSMLPHFGSSLLLHLHQANQIRSHGACLALLPPDPSCSASLRSVLGLPRSDLCALKPAPHHPTPTSCYCTWRQAQGVSGVRYHWKVR
jgi:hypothetical protein